MFKRDDVVEILTEFQDQGDCTFSWVVLNDEEKGRVDISPVCRHQLEYQADLP